MTGNQFGRVANDWTISGATIADPGNGGTLNLNSQSLVVCEVKELIERAAAA